MTNPTYETTQLTRNQLKDIEIRKQRSILLLCKTSNDLLIKENVSLKGQLDINIYPYIDDILLLNMKAIDLFKKDECFLCGKELIWNQLELYNNTGRMFNISNVNVLDKANWFSVCIKCYKLLNLNIKGIQIKKEDNKNE